MTRTPDTPENPDHAFTHSQLAELAHYLADSGHDADTVAYAVEKPWKYPDAWQAIQSDIPADQYDPE